MAGFLAGLGAGAQGILGQRAANQKAAEEAQNLAIDQATARIQQQNALLNQRKLQDAEKASQARQAALDELRKTNPQLADLLALGLTPKDLATPQAKPMLVPQKDGSVKLVFPTPDMSGQVVGYKTLPESATDKFLDLNISNLPGKTVLDASGRPFTNPLLTVRDALGMGGSIYTDKNAAEMANSMASEANLDTLLNAGSKVLPPTVPTTTGEGLRDTMINPAVRWYRAKTDPTYADYEHAKAGIITYMRDLAKAGRINQGELNLIVDRLNGAQTLPALQGAVDTAKQILRQDRLNLGKSGGATASPSSSKGSSSEAQERILPDGRRAWLRKNNGKVEILEPSGWVPYNG